MLLRAASEVADDFQVFVSARAHHAAEFGRAVGTIVFAFRKLVKRAPVLRQPLGMH